MIDSNEIYDRGERARLNASMRIFAEKFISAKIKDLIDRRRTAGKEDQSIVEVRTNVDGVPIWVTVPEGSVQPDYHIFPETK